MTEPRAEMTTIWERPVQAVSASAMTTIATRPSLRTMVLETRREATADPSGGVSYGVYCLEDVRPARGSEAETPISPSNPNRLEEMMALVDRDSDVLALPPVSWLLWPRLAKGDPLDHIIGL